MYVKIKFENPVDKEYYDNLSYDTHLKADMIAYSLKVSQGKTDRQILIRHVARCVISIVIIGKVILFICSVIVILY